MPIVSPSADRACQHYLGLASAQEPVYSSPKLTSERL